MPHHGLWRQTFLSVALGIALPLSADAQVDRPYKGAYFIFVDNSSPCELFVYGDQPYRFGPNTHNAIPLPASAPWSSRPLQVNGAERTRLPVRQHSIVSLDANCDAIITPIDASEAVEQFEAELEQIDGGNARWRARGARKVLLGTLLSLGGIAAIASGSNAGVGAGFAVLGIGFGAFMEAGSDYRRARLNQSEYDRVQTLQQWIRVVESR